MRNSNVRATERGAWENRENKRKKECNKNKKSKKQTIIREGATI
jgi:hypothetical protein